MYTNLIDLMFTLLRGLSLFVYRYTSTSLTIGLSSTLFSCHKLYSFWNLLSSKNQNMNTKKNSSKTSTIIAIFIFIIALINLTSSTFSFILITLSAIIVSPLSKKIFKHLTKQKLLLLRITSPIIAILWGIMISASSDRNKKIAYQNRDKEFVKNYLNNHKNMMPLKQIDSIYHLHDYFEGAYKNNSDSKYLEQLLKPTQKHLDQNIYNQNAYSKSIDTINKTSTIIYNPYFLVKNISDEFQNKIDGKLIARCELLFNFDSNQELKSLKTMVTYNNDTKISLDTLEMHFMHKYINKTKVKNQKNYIKARIKIAKL